MPVPPDVFSVIAYPPVVPFFMIYVLDTVGHMMFIAAVNVPVTFNIAFRASSLAPSVEVSVWSEEPETAIAPIPVMACSNNVPILVFV